MRLDDRRFGLTPGIETASKVSLLSMSSVPSRCCTGFQKTTESATTTTPERTMSDTEDLP